MTAKDDLKTASELAAHLGKSDHPAIMTLGAILMGCVGLIYADSGESLRKVFEMVNGMSMAYLILHGKTDND